MEEWKKERKKNYFEKMFVLLSIASLLSTNRRSVSYPRCGFESFNPKNLILFVYC